MKTKEYWLKVLMNVAKNGANVIITQNFTFMVGP